MDDRGREKCENCGKRRVIAWIDVEGVGLCKPCGIEEDARALEERG